MWFLCIHIYQVLPKRDKKHAQSACVLPWRQLNLHLTFELMGNPSKADEANDMNHISATYSRQISSVYDKITTSSCLGRWVKDCVHNESLKKSHDPKIQHISIFSICCSETFSLRTTHWVQQREKERARKQRKNQPFHSSSGHHYSASGQLLPWKPPESRA